MREAPVGVADADVADAVRQAWSAGVDAVEHLPVGFGAHHWAAAGDGRPILFVTLDQLGGRHSAASLESAYAEPLRWPPPVWSSCWRRCPVPGAGTPCRSPAGP